VELEGRGPYYRDLSILSSDNQRIERKIGDALYDNGMDRYDEKANLSDFVFLPENSYPKFGGAPTDDEIVAAVQPFLPQLESLRKEISKIGDEK
jgi:hypothetical protein